MNPPPDAQRSAASMNIRRAGPTDADVVLTMLVELARHENSLDHVDLDEARLATLLARPDVTILIAEIDGDPVGYVSAARQVKFWTGGEITALDDLFVRDGYRNRNIGEALMRTLASLTADDTPIIRWEVDTDNHSGLRFYARLGASIRTKCVASWTGNHLFSGDRRLQDSR